MSRWDNVLYFAIRHGRTRANDEKIYRSWSNDPKAQLDKDGRRDAEEAGEFLASVGVSVELVIADSLDRTQETAEIVAKILGVDRIEFLRALHPLNMGDWTLESKEEHPVEEYIKDKSKRIPGGETVDEFNGREFTVFEKINQLAAENMGGRIVVVGHGSTVSFLHNEMFNQGEPVVGYEGLVDPGGVVAVTENGLIPLTKVRERRGRIGKRIGGQKLTAIQAGYMELAGAAKDAGCAKVNVPGGVSKDLGCCNEFEPKDSQVAQFKCANCEYLLEENENGSTEAGDAGLGGADDR